MKQGALILCGGKSSRMGSDKAFLSFQNLFLIEHVLNAVKALQIPVQLVGDPARFAPFGIPVVPDEVKDQGPMRGILSGMKSVDWERILVLSCDTPFVKPALLSHLLRESINTDILVPSVHGKIHPLIGVYHACIRPEMERLLEAQQLRMTSLLNAVNSRILDLSDHPEFGEEKLYVNLNTPEDVKLWE